MQRWHKTDCTNPDVVTLADKIPQCRACHSRPQIEELISSNVSTSSVPLVPPDLPPGKMDLWWFLVATHRPLLNLDDRKFRSKLSTSERTDGSKRKERDICAAIYTRLLIARCIYHWRSIIWTIALNIEALSYTWAGENGDNTPSQPIYIGPFWDILLQTKNCWAMLQFMRPLRIPRIIWVDAVCINQGNSLQRSIQVANMRKVYSTCSRVVVYLGPDIAIPLFDRHPRRGTLHEFETGELKPYFPNNCGGSQFSPNNLRDILKLRYFSRIWVVQELILSQRVVIRIGDVDFWADSTMATHFSSKVPGWDWRTTAATWMQFTSQGTSRELSLGELLEMSSASRATDPRDRIFGLLGILPERKTQSSSQRPRINDSILSIKREIRADYSLSCQQTFIGFFAYCLLNKNELNILYGASCLSRNKPDYPTWVPNWTSATTWMTLFQAPELTGLELNERILELLEDLPTNEKDLWYKDAFYIYELQGPSNRYIAKERHWKQGAFINASNASLNINLTQYMVISRPLEQVGTINGLRLFCMRHDFLNVYIVSKERLDTVLTGKGNEELFILNIDDRSFIYLLLRRQTDEHGAVTHKLISACPQVQILVRTQRAENKAQKWRELRLDSLQFSLYDVLEQCRAYLDDPLMYFLRDPRDSGLFVGITALRDLVPVLKQLYQIRSQHDTSIHWSESGIITKNPRFLHAIGEAFIQCVDQKFSPQFDGIYITISVSTLWEEICRIYFFRSDISYHQNYIWKYRFKDPHEDIESLRRSPYIEPSWKSPYIEPSIYDNLLGSNVELWLEIQFPMDWVIYHLTKNPILHCEELFIGMDILTYHLGTIGEDLWSLVVEGSEHDSDLKWVACSNDQAYIAKGLKSTDIYAQLGMERNTFMVCID